MTHAGAQAKGTAEEGGGNGNRSILQTGFFIWAVSVLAAGAAILGVSLWTRSGIDVDPKTSHGKHGVVAWRYMEAPELARRVAAGTLPPLAERLPENPMLVQPVERVGRYGGTWHLALVGEAEENSDHPLLLRTIGYENLVRWDPQWARVVPNVAERFSVSSDAKVYDFWLRKGMKWSDGASFTADDIIFWYRDVLVNPALTKAVPDWLTSRGHPVVVEKIDLWHVRFRFEEPNGLFLQNLAAPRGAMATGYPEHYLKRYLLQNDPVGVMAMTREAGLTNWVSLFYRKASDSVLRAPRWQNPELPMLHAWILTNGYGSSDPVVAVRNPYYWKIDPAGRQLPYIDRVEFAVAKSSEDLTERVVRGEIDMQDRNLATAANFSRFEVNRLRGDYHFFRTISAFGNTMVISLNMTHPDPELRNVFQNRDFRIGLSYGINRRAIIDEVYAGQGEAYQAAPSPSSPFYHEQLAHQYVEYDVDLANQYLDRAGYLKKDSEGYRLRGDGKRISFEVEVAVQNRDHFRAMKMIQRDWKVLGVEIRVASVERRKLTDDLAFNRHDAVAWLGNGGLDVIMDPIYYFPFSTDSAYAVCWAHWNLKEQRQFPAEEPPEPVVEQMRLYHQLGATADSEEQARLMYQILDIAANQFYVMGISHPGQGYGIVRNGFHNVPSPMPAAWTYPHPAPTNPCQYFIEPEPVVDSANGAGNGNAILELERE